MGTRCRSFVYISPTAAVDKGYGAVYTVSIKVPGLSSLGALICGARLWLNLHRLDFMDQDLTGFVAC